MLPFAFEVTVTMASLLDSSAALPIDAPSGESKRPRRRPVEGRVLWVDDDPNITAAVTRRFRRRGVQVWPASDGMQGYWMAVTRKPDVIVTDLKMPRWEGRDMLECLLANDVTVDIPVVVLSGYVTPDERRRMERIGVAAVLDKPASWRTLLTTIRSLLRKE